MARQMMKTAVFTLVGVLAGALFGAWLDWHAYLGNPTRSKAPGNRAFNYDVEAFGQASLVVGPKDYLELTVNGQSDPYLQMNFAGNSTPCAGNANHKPNCQVADPGNVQKFYVFDCTAQNNEPYNCPDPGIKQTGSGGNMDPDEFIVALKIDLLCILGCDLESILGPKRLTFPALPTPAAIVSPPREDKNGKPKIAASTPANTYAYVFCSESANAATVRPMNPQLGDNAQASVSLSAKNPFYWVSNDPIKVSSAPVLAGPTPTPLCSSSPIVQPNNGIYVASCTVASTAKSGQTYNYQLQDPSCGASSQTAAETIMTVP
jgi:hypothetical protein